MNEEILKVVVVDDEPDIREKLVEVIDKCTQFDVVGEADSVNSAYSTIVSLQPDVVFLDVKIKGGNAFQLLDKLKATTDRIPPIVLNTGFDDFEYAQKSFNIYRDEIIMILKKPFWENWEQKKNEILPKIKSHQEINRVPEILNNRLKIKSEYTTYLIRLEDLIYIEVDTESKGRGKLKIVTKNKVIPYYQSLNTLEAELPSQFVRISRYTIINTEFMVSYHHTDQILHLRDAEEYTFTVGNSYKAKLLDLLD